MSSVRIVTGFPPIACATLRLELGFLSGKVAPEKEELRTEKSDSVSPVLDDGIDLFGHLDVGLQEDALPIPGRGRKVPDALECVFLEQSELVGSLFAPECFAVRVDDDDAPVPVDDEGGHGNHVRSEAPDSEDGGNLESAREYGGVARPSSRLGDDSLDPSPDHGDHIRGQQLLGDENHIHLDVGKIDAFAMQEVAKYPAHHIVDVGNPLLQVRIRGRGKLVDHLLLEGEDDAFDVREKAREPEFDAFLHFRVVEHHEMGVEYGRLLLAGYFERLVAQAYDVGLGHCDCIEEASVLRFHLLAGYGKGGYG